MPAARPPTIRAAKSTPIEGAKAATRSAGIVRAMPEEQDSLAAVAIADRAEVENGAGEPEGVGDRDQIEIGLRSIEMLADVG